MKERGEGEGRGRVEGRRKSVRMREKGRRGRMGGGLENFFLHLYHRVIFIIF